MEILRTPDDRFESLPDFPFEPRWAEIPIDADAPGDGTLRVHYVDEGPSDAAPILLLHGEPSWAYLYRFVIPPLVEAGHRVVVPDQVGFGRSDKPASTDDYTYARHVAWMSSLVFDHLDLTDVTFFGQDWGGLVGLRLVAAQPERFARVAIANTGLPTGDPPPGDAFLRWQRYSQEAPSLDIGALVDGATLRDLTDAERAAYDAPFPDDSFKAGARIWPSLVVTSPDGPGAADNRAAWEVLKAWEKPFLCCFSDGDPLTGGGDRPFRRLVPGARDQPHLTLAGGGHFLQEDVGPELADVLDRFVAGTLGGSGA